MDVEKLDSIFKTSASIFSHRASEIRKKLLLLVLAAIFCFVTILAIRRQDHIKGYIKDHAPAQLTHGSSGKGSKVETGGLRKLTDETLEQLNNRTLGFQKTFTINLPSRSDKLDAIRVAADLTGFDLDVIEGVNGDDLPDKALPGPWKEGPHKGASVGCWRAHMDFAHTIVKNHISTALVFEDDSDWDVSFREQLRQFAIGSQYIMDTPIGSTPHSPYGDDWDLIWLGHCSNKAGDEDPRRFVIENDPTVTPLLHRTNFGIIPKEEMPTYPNNTRIVFESTRGICLYGYALSHRGAQKVLYYLSMSPWHSAVDFGIEDMCRDPARNFRCVGVFPQIVDSHRAAGGSNKDSDISSKKVQVRKKGFTYNIVHSTRLNANTLMDGNTSLVESQWPNEDMHIQPGGVKMGWYPKGYPAAV